MECRSVSPRGLVSAQFLRMDCQRSILQSDWFYHKTPYGEHERVQEGWQAISEIAFFSTNVPLAAGNAMDAFSGSSTVIVNSHCCRNVRARMRNADTFGCQIVWRVPFRMPGVRHGIRGSTVQSRIGGRGEEKKKEAEGWRR